MNKHLIRTVKSYLGLLVYVYSLFSCTDEDVFENNNDLFRIIGYIEQSSKTEYEIENNKVSVSWAKDDNIGLFTNEQKKLLQYKAYSEGKRTSFIPVEACLNHKQGKEVCAFYPYNNDSTSYPLVKLPHMIDQEYISNNILAKNDLMYAKGVINGDELVLNFKHIFAFLKVNIDSELLKGSKGLFIRSDEPLMYYATVAYDPYYNFEKGGITAITDNFLRYYIPTDTINKLETITCYIAMLPTSENNYLSFYKLNSNKAGNGLLEKKAPKGGFQAGHVYELTIKSDEFDIDKISQKEKQALIVLYETTGGDQWTNNLNWCSNKPLEDWYGVTVVDGTVSELDLSLNNLTGEIPSEIGELEHLKSLYLSDNNIGGELPASISKLKRLMRLSLFGNSLEGDIPESFSTLINKLEYINLNINNFTGKIPEAIINNSKWKDLWCGIIGGGFDMSGVKLPAPDFIVQDINGETISSDTEYTNNELTAILYWSSTCPFSSSFIEYQLLPLYEKYRQRGFEIIGYSSENNIEIQNYINKNNIKWKNFKETDMLDQYMPGNSITALAPIIGTPTILLINKNKEVIFQSITEERKKIQEIVSEYLSDSDLYTSSDYSRDGEVQILQKATKGKGINLVFMGEAFVDKDMGDNGLYEQVMREAVEQYFAYEPLKSFRDRFNVYSVKVVSPNAEFTSNAVHRINEDNSICFEYAKKVPGLENAPYQMISVIYNKGCSQRSYTSMYTDGSYVAYMMEGGNNVLNHEACGHGFGKLYDEYIENGNENKMLPDSKREEMDEDWKYFQFGANVDWRNNTEEVKWAHFLNDIRYKNEMLGLYEGSYLYGKGAYRPTENSMMRYNDSPFNAPSREQIYRVIMKLSEGDEWEYDYEEFVSYDEINRNYKTSYSLRTPPSKMVIENWVKRHRHPILIKGRWKDQK